MAEPYDVKHAIAVICTNPRLILSIESVRLVRIAVAILINGDKTFTANITMTKQKKSSNKLVMWVVQITTYGHVSVGLFISQYFLCCLDKAT
jgi:hypothetical protein